jgi:hypothetical protein
MLRYLIIAIALLFVSPAWSQERIFRASLIDIEQNNRLDVLESQHTIFKADAESRLGALEAKQTAAPKVKVTQKSGSPQSDPVTGYVPSGPTVLMITNGSCPHCEAWWEKYEVPLSGKGWDVVKQTGYFAGVDLYPTFRVFNAGKWTQ